MKQSNDFAFDMLDMDVNREKIVYNADRNIKVSEKNGVIILDIPFYGYYFDAVFKKTETEPLVKRFFLSTWGDSCLRFLGPMDLGANFDDIVKSDNESPMLCFSDGLRQNSLSLKEIEKDIFIAVRNPDSRRFLKHVQAIVKTVPPIVADSAVFAQLGVICPLE